MPSLAANRPNRELGSLVGSLAGYRYCPTRHLISLSPQFESSLLRGRVFQCKFNIPTPRRGLGDKLIGINSRSQPPVQLKDPSTSVFSVRRSVTVFGTWWVMSTSDLQTCPTDDGDAVTAGSELEASFCVRSPSGSGAGVYARTERRGRNFVDAARISVPSDYTDVGAHQIVRCDTDTSLHTSQPAYRLFDASTCALAYGTTSRNSTGGLGHKGDAVEAVKKHLDVDTIVDFASSRRVYSSTLEVLRSGAWRSSRRACPSSMREILYLAQKKGVLVIGHDRG
ncbi:hypothetical protein K439DRAFT_1523910 [Ramaria rubella]|nr:hypothetical protein K439DRAFT_1523910 [Ramaria rubella]